MGCVSAVVAVWLDKRRSDADGEPGVADVGERILPVQSCHAPRWVKPWVKDGWRLLEGAMIWVKSGV